MLTDRKVYESELEAQLAKWKADLDVLKAKAKRAEVGAMVTYDEALEALERKHGEASAHLGRLREATDEAWEGVKAGTEKAWGEFKALFRSAPGA